MPTSSKRFEVLIRPDPLLRRVVLISGGVCALTGASLLATASLPYPLRFVLSLLWLADCWRRLRAQVAGHRAVTAVRLAADGKVAVISPLGRARPASLVTGTVLHQRLAWLRLRRPGGGYHGEALRRTWLGETDWHRLCLIRRQADGGFGHHGGA